MLLLIYDRAILEVSSGVQELSTESGTEIVQHRFQAQKAILLLAEGLDLQQGEVPQNIMQLCLFALEQISGDDIDQWQAAGRVLATLRNAFESIRDEANRMENNKQIPALA
jgi:flagellin-specific chaperone FliS